MHSGQRSGKPSNGVRVHVCVHKNCSIPETAINAIIREVEEEREFIVICILIIGPVAYCVILIKPLSCRKVI